MTAETHYLDCPNCGEAVFARPENAFLDGEEETCACGARLMVSCDSESEPYAVDLDEDEEREDL